MIRTCILTLALVATVLLAGCDRKKHCSYCKPCLPRQARLLDCDKPECDCGCKSGDVCRCAR